MLILHVREGFPPPPPDFMIPVKIWEWSGSCKVVSCALTPPKFSSVLCSLFYGVAGTRAWYLLQTSIPGAQSSHVSWGSQSELPDPRPAAAPLGCVFLVIRDKIHAARWDLVSPVCCWLAVAVPYLLLWSGFCKQVSEVCNSHCSPLIEWQSFLRLFWDFFGVYSNSE